MGGTERKRRVRWPVVVVPVAALALVAAALVVVLTGGSKPAGPATAAGSTLPDKFRLALAAKVVQILETSTPSEHLSHGHDLTGNERIMCTVDPFGTDPPGVTDVSQVRWVYALHLCAYAEPGTPWLYASKTSGPLAAQLTTPPTVILPVPTRDYRTQVTQMIPARYLTQAFGNFAHPDLIARLRDQYDKEIASASPPASPAN
jgi:hypothetical protein